MNNKKRRTPNIYKQHPEAIAFLKAHPEFANASVEGRGDIDPRTNKTSDLVRRSPKPDHAARAHTIQEALPYIKYEKFRKSLTLYFEGHSHTQIAKALGLRDKRIAVKLINRAKLHALHIMKAPMKAEGDFTSEPLATKTITHNGRKETLYLRYDKLSDDHLWFTSTGVCLPESIQEILDNEPGIMEWDDIALT